MKLDTNKISVRLVVDGVNLYDADGSMLVGISERQAVLLHKHLTKMMPRLKATIKKFQL